MASCSQTGAGTRCFVLFKYLFFTVHQSSRKNEVFWQEGRKWGAQEAGALHVVVLLVPGALLLTEAHRAAATLAFVTVTSQVLCIVQEIVRVRRDHWHPPLMGELHDEGAPNQTTGLCVL